MPDAERALAGARAIIEHIASAGRTGNEARAIAETPPPPFLQNGALVLSEELLQRFEVALAGKTGNGIRPIYRSNSRPDEVRFQTPAATPAPAPRGDVNVAQRLASPLPGHRRREAIAPTRLPADGEVEIVVLRDGLELGSEKFIAGDRVLVGPDAAQRLMRTGAADLASPAAPRESTL